MGTRRRYFVGGGLLLTLALGGASVGWFAFARGRAEASQAEKKRAPVDPAKADARMLEVLQVSREPAVEASRRLVELYAQWASDPDALAARRSALTLLFAERAIGLRLQRVLEAVSADATPPEDDPLWQDVVNKLSEQWNTETFDKGRDLMQMEERDRARAALVESFTELPDSDRFASLTAEQRQALINDLIDMHPRVGARQKKEIETALRKLAGNDPADLLAGRGINDGHKLEIQAQYERELQNGMRQLTK